MSVRYALLGLLAQRPRYGYELYSAFEALVGGDNWNLRPAQVYTTLERLERAGLVEKQPPAQEGAERRIFTITEPGRASLHRWFAEGVASKHEQDEFFVKLATCLISGEADPTAVIQTQRAALFRQLHDATALRDGFDPRCEMARILLLDKAVMHLEADLRWLDITEQRLDEVKRQPLPEPEIRPRGRPRKGDRNDTHQD
jgi:DNA-binding PadR family transcriptional regulator